MTRRQLVVIGGGISGLSAAYRLKKLFPEAEVTVLEKEKRAGGWIQTKESQGFLFEMGPRVFKGSKSKDLLKLIDELGLRSKIVVSKGSGHRYVLEKGILKRLPGGFLSFLFSSYFVPVMRALIKEWHVEPFKGKDESVASFIKRRFGKEVYSRLFDPLVQGIYAADPEHLSIQACFRELKRLEDTYGSVVRGLVKERLMSQEKQPRSSLHNKLFSIDGGVESIIDALKKSSSFTIDYRHRVLSIQREGDRYCIETDRRRVMADGVFIATDAFSASNILQSSASYVSHLLKGIPSVSITSVCVGFKAKVLSQSGFGYLVPTKENTPLLGCVFDSEAFHDHKGQTRLTLMLRGSGYSDKDLHNVVQESLSQHLSIRKEPDFIETLVSERCIPQFLVGHTETIERIDSEMAKVMPGCMLIGNYIGGVSVSDCIATATQSVDHFMAGKG